MFNKKVFIVLFLLIIAIGAISSVSANDLSDNAIADSNDDTLMELGEDTLDDSNDEVLRGLNESPLADSNDETISDSLDNVELKENNEINFANEEKNDENTNDASDIISTKDASDKALKDSSDWATFSALRSALSDMPAGAKLDLAINFYCDDNKNIPITKPFTIDGHGFTFDARGKAGIFIIKANNVVLQNINFINGNGLMGGAIDIFNTTTYTKTTIINCTFSNNAAEIAGGAISTTGELIVKNCSFYNNKVTLEDDTWGGGGAIFANYPSLGYDSVNVSDSRFYNNSATIGGAISLSSETWDGGFANTTGKSYIKNSVFESNEASKGGAIYNLQYTDIADCEFIANNASNDGGAIYSNNGEYYDDQEYGVFAQTFGLEIHGKTSFIQNTAKGNGGAIKVYANSTFLEKGVKGIIKVYDNVLFEGNSAENGGALSIVDSNSDIKYATFKNNKAKTASAIEGGSATNCIFEGNSEPAISGTEIVEDHPGQIILKQSGTYYNDKTLTITLIDGVTKAGIKNAKINVKFSNGKSVTLTTNANGVATYSIPFDPGTYTATASSSDNRVHASAVTLSNIKIAKVPITISPAKLSTTYASGKYFQVKVINSKTKKAMAGAKLKLKVYTGKKYKTVTVTTDAKGIAKYSASTLKIGKHNVVVSNGNKKCMTGSDKKSTIKVSKGKYAIIAPKVTNAYKKGTFKITIKNKASGKVLKAVKLSVKVYTGSKFKKYSVKTNKKGIARLSTKTLKKGSHKVIISTKATTYYKAGKKSSSVKIK